MPLHFIPRRDGSFDTWQVNFAAYVDAHFGELGLTAQDAAKLNDSASGWDKAYRAHAVARAAAQSARETKAAARAGHERLIREFAGRIRGYAKTTDGDRASLGITVPDTEPTVAAPPSTRPVVKVDFSKRLRHTLRYADESTPTRRARPRGVIGAEIWVQVAALGDPAPTDPGELTFLQLSTRTPAVIEYAGQDAGKTAHYMVRWLNTRGEHGPWSETASATVGA